ncbi:MAG: MFS transporter [Candidatus Lokiarchaeota archaeon]|nr:MFS transporter [Candidatus Lokiarchaeota archaeon]MBD3201612.1 MFS transporter [Candidatus Lokiarchaeota archaeon]
MYHNIEILMISNIQYINYFHNNKHFLYGIGLPELSESKWEDSKANRVFSYPRLFPLWAAVFIDILGFYLVIPFLPSFIEVYSTTPWVIGVVIAVNAVFTLFFAPLWGKLSDSYGRKPMLLISQLGTLSAFMILAFSNSFLLIFLSRVIDGIFGGNFPIAKAIISDVVPPKDRGVQMANVGVAHVLSSLIGPGLGGILFSLGGILYPGLLASILSLTTILLTLGLLEESWPDHKRKISKEESESNFSIRKDKNALYLLILWGFHTISFTLLVSNMSLFLSSIIGLVALEIGIILTISGIFRATTRFVFFKPILKRIGEKNMILMGLGIFIFMFLFVGFLRNIVLIMSLLIIISFSASSVRGNLLSVISQSASRKVQGRINSYTTSLDSVAQIISPVMGGIIFDLSVRDIIEPYWWSIIMATIGAIAFLMFYKKYKINGNKE